MAELLNIFTDPAPFMPHGMCLLWHPALIWTHLVSDVLTGLAYFSIPVALLVFARRRVDLAYRWMFVLFGIFIFACGTTHLFGAWTLWQPDYVAQGMAKAVTAAASVGTAIAIWPLIPRALALPSPAQLRTANEALGLEVIQRQQAERAVREANAALEARVADRTQKLAEANRQLRDMNDTLERRVADRTAELEAAVRALRESEARYSGIVQNASDSIFVLDVEADGTLRFAAVNPALERDTGIPAERIVGRTPHEALNPDLVDDMVDRYRQCIRSGRPQSYEEVVERDGRRRIWQTALAPVIDPATGDVVQIIGSSRNITEQRAMRDQLAHAAKLATLGTLAAGVAHEMSQPLNAIRVSASDLADLLREEGLSADPDYVLQGLDTIREQSARMGSVVDQMRQFGRQDPSAARRFDPAEPVRRAARLLSRGLESAGIALVLEVPETAPEVNGWANRLEQVMLNLLSNAVDAIEEARRQDPRARRGRIVARLATDMDVVTITVEDDGIGLAQDVADRIFDPFFTTKDEEKGMGLGLSICAGIIDAMGGFIRAEGLGHGARMKVVLPVAADAPADAPINAPTDGPKVTA